MRRPLTSLLLAAALAALVGCGESDQEQAREVVQDYVEARNAGDSETACDLFSDDFKQSLGTEDCAAFIEEQSAGADGEEELRIVDVRVRDDRAMADIDVVRPQQGPIRIGLTLERQDGDWKITALQ
jgi:hypothetical protein